LRSKENRLTVYFQILGVAERKFGGLSKLQKDFLRMDNIVKFDPDRRAANGNLCEGSSDDDVDILRLPHSSIQIDNLLFGKYSIGLVREVLNLSTIDISQRLEIKYHTWRSYEYGKRQLPVDLKVKLERIVMKEFAHLVCP
jgi:hypothetical protein